MRTGTIARVIGVAFCLLTASVAYAHDIWLLPDRFVLSRGDMLAVRQMVGSEHDIEELPLLRRMTPRFELVTASGSVDLMSKLPTEKAQPVVKPVLERKLDFDGLALLAMDHAFIYHELSGEKFLEYLEHEEFKEKFRDRVGHRPEERERYARTLKCLIQVGEAVEGDLYKRVLGQKLEIVLLQNPYQLGPGDDLEVQVLFDGKPLPDQLVTALNGDRERLVSKSKARTNTRGIASFNLDQGGYWLVRLVHLLPCSDLPCSDDDVDCCDVEWESYWSSFSFQLDGLTLQKSPPSSSEPGGS